MHPCNIYEMSFQNQPKSRHETFWISGKAISLEFRDSGSDLMLCCRTTCRPSLGRRSRLRMLLRQEPKPIPEALRRLGSTHPFLSVLSRAIGRRAEIPGSIAEKSERRRITRNNIRWEP